MYAAVNDGMQWSPNVSHLAPCRVQSGEDRPGGTEGATTDGTVRICTRCLISLTTNPLIENEKKKFSVQQSYIHEIM
jgi:hypothetical protein